jgi:protein TonB
MPALPMTTNNITDTSHKDTLWIALFIAALIHIVVILGVNFSAPQVERINKEIHITLVNTPAKKPPKKARFLAQDDQIGAGESSKEPQPLSQKLPSVGNNPDKPIKKLAPEEAVAKVAPTPKTVVQAKAKETVTTAPAKPNVIEPQPQEERPHLSADILQQQIMQLGSEIAVKKQSADETNIKFVESVSAHKYIAAQYIRDWESKVERIGNLNYPEVAAKKNFSGILTMDVGINADGSIYSIIISKSSGNNALDEAAKQIVRMGAPYPPLPLDLLKELKVLAISRVWQFSDESLTTH